MSKTMLISFQDQYTEDFVNETSIDEDYVLSYICRYSEPGMPGRQLGVHYLLLNGNDKYLKNVYDLIISQKLDSLIRVDPNRPSSLYKKFIIKNNDEYHVNIVDNRLPPDEKLNSLEQAINEVLLHHKILPMKACNISAEILPRKLKPGENFEVIIRLSNTGKYAINIGNPASFKRDSGDIFKINFYEKEVDQSADSFASYSFSIILTEKEYKLNQRKALPSDKPTITLQAGEDVQVRITDRFPKCNKGFYLAEFVYIYVPNNEEDIDLVWGEYHGDRIGVEVY